MNENPYDKINEYLIQYLEHQRKAAEAAKKIEENPSYALIPLNAFFIENQKRSNAINRRMMKYNHGATFYSGCAVLVAIAAFAGTVYSTNSLLFIIAEVLILGALVVLAYVGISQQREIDGLFEEDN